MFYLTFFRFLKYFGKGHSKQIWLMGIYTFLTSLFDFVSVAIILPFLIMLIDPSGMTGNRFLRILQKVFHLESNQEVFIYASAILVITILAKNIYCIFIMYWQNKLLKEWALDIKQMFMRMYLYSPFEMNVKTGDSERFFQIEKIVDTVFNNFVFRVIVFTSNTLCIILIFLWMIWILPKYTILAALFFILSASLQNKIIFKQAKAYADKKYKLEKGSYSTLMFSLRCLKEIKITSSENYFYGIYDKMSKRMLPWIEKINLLPIIPQYLIEIVFVITVIILFAGIYIEYGMNTPKILLALGIIAISLFRILPLMSKSQVCINYIDMYREYPPQMFELYDDFKKYENYISVPVKDRMKFEKEIKIENLSYSYNKEKFVLEDINFTIKKGEYLGIVGLSGAGKTTLIDCLSGLLLGEGVIKIDEQVLNAENIKSYQNIIGYVSQSTQTINSSITTNIAWGIPDKDIDEERVIQAVKEANLYGQINEMPKGLSTVINQDGSGLSQGQKQRIAIARAFYRNPDILIFDEATSSLDVKTENEIMEILSRKKGEITMIAVSHRLSTLKQCDKILYIEHGKIVDIDTFANLTDKYSNFAEFVKLSNLTINQTDENYSENNNPDNSDITEKD